MSEIILFLKSLHQYEKTLLHFKVFPFQIETSLAPLVVLQKTWPSGLALLITFWLKYSLSLFT